MRVRTSIDPDLVPLLECIDSKRNVWRLRWDIQDGSHEEYQLDHKPTLPEIKEIILGWYNTQIQNRIIYGFKYKGMSVCLSRENQSNYMMFCETDLFPIQLKFGSWDNPIFYTIKTSAELKEFKRKISEHIKNCLQLGWTQKNNINWASYEKIINQ